jgi:hypothetical protein
LGVTNGFTINVGSHAVVLLRLNSNGVGAENNNRGAAITTSKKNILIQKTSRGVRLFVPAAQAGAPAELLDIRGKRICTFRVNKDWNYLPNRMLLPGVFIVRGSLFQRFFTIEER